jgi:hypothetical protein
VRLEQRVEEAVAEVGDELHLGRLDAPDAAARPADPEDEVLELELLERQPSEWDEQEVVDAVWRGESLGTLAWALTLFESLPGYDRPFDHVAVAQTLRLDAARLRPLEEISTARDIARLWHWRARTALLQEQGAVELPERWQTFDQLVAATAMRGYEQGLLPAPLRGDFPAFGKVYRQLDAEQRSLALSVAAERHYALNWLLDGDEWDDVVTDT